MIYKITLHTLAFLVVATLIVLSLILASFVGFHIWSVIATTFFAWWFTVFQIWVVVVFILFVVLVVLKIREEGL